MKTSVQDLLITGWAIVLVITVGVIAFHPSFKADDSSEALRLSGFTLFGTLAGIVLVRYVEQFGRMSARTRSVMLGIFVLCMIPLVFVMYVTFAMPWVALIILTLVYVRWKWSLAASSG